MLRFHGLVCICCLVGAPLFGFSLQNLEPDTKYLHVYYGKMHNFSLAKAVSFVNLNDVNNELDSYILSFGFGMQSYVYKNIVSIGPEINIASHWDNNDKLTSEIAIPLILRYDIFNHYKYIPIYVAVGDGLSYAPSVPEYEKKYGYTVKGNTKTMDDPLLNFLLLEIGTKVVDNIELFGRVHHRCTGFGALDPYGKKGGVNYLTLGARYYF